MLLPLQKWYCDTCGELIEKPEQGYVQFKKVEKNGIYVYTDFTIVHHKKYSPNKNQKSCYKYDSDSDLGSFLGEHGMVELLSMLDPGVYHLPKYIEYVENIRNWVEFFRRLQVPYYEEARKYISRAYNDGYYTDENEIYIYLPENLKRLIEHYEDISNED